MNENEWNELQRAWKSSPQQAEPVIAEIERLRRRRRWLAVGVAIEAVIAVAGLSVGVALLLRGGSLFIVTGIATCGFVVLVCALSLWVWLLPQPRPEDAVEHAVAVARQHARIGVRHATATIWALVLSMVFMAVIALARGLLSDTAALAGFIAIGIGQLGVAAWFALAFRYYQARAAALARLDAIAAALDQ